MKFAFKKICIEAPFPTTQCGHSCQTFEVSEYKDHLYARVFSFKDENNCLIHISMDLLGCTIAYRNKLQDGIREKLGKDVHVITSTTHTHYANSCRNDKYLEWLYPVLVEGVCSLDYQEVGEVSSSYQIIPCDATGKSRISGYETNNEFLVLIRYFTGEKNILNWVINNCHPTTLAATSPFFSAEYPGVVLKKLEDKYGFNFTFGQGASGDISTRFVREGQTYEDMLKVADKLFVKVDKLMSFKAERKPLKLDYKEEVMAYQHDFSPIDISNLPANISQREKETIEIGNKMRDKIKETKTFLGMPLTDQILSAWNMGSVKLIFFPNEMFSEYLNELDLNNTYLLSYSNGYGPYVLPADFKQVTYEMCIDTTSRDTKAMIKKMIKEI